MPDSTARYSDTDTFVAKRCAEWCTAPQHVLSKVGFCRGTVHVGLTEASSRWDATRSSGCGMVGPVALAINADTCHLTLWPSG